jgi:thiol-disulfide isomerase/thioredoxin
MPTSVLRTADPYRDLDVIDARAPRFNQAAIGSLSLLAVLTGWWPILALLALQLAIGLRFGRRYCVACVAYFELVQPLIGEGPIEDSRPPRFANQVGLVVLGTATVAYAVGLTTLGAALGLLVAGLALLAASTGLCVGCEMYRIVARLRGIRAHQFDRIELVDMGASFPVDGELVVAFSHPLCTDCRDMIDDLQADGRQLVTVDVRERPELARKYGIALVPTAVSVTADGRVTARLVG